MLRRCLILILLVPAAVLLGACSSGDDPAIRSSASTSTTTPDGPEATLSGEGGAATFSYELSPARSEFCFRITAAEAIVSAGVLRESGDRVLDLPVGQGQSEVNTCAATDSITVEEIDREPARFRIEVETAKGTSRAPLR